VPARREAASQRELTAERLRYQSAACGYLGSPLYAELLARAADDALAGGPVWRVLEEVGDWPDGSAIVLRLMGAVQRLVMLGDAPDELAREYRPGGSGERAWPGFRALVDDRLDDLRPLVRRPVQTNEVGRAAALAPAFLWLARECGDRPLRLLELGSSAGLNLRWDAYRYGSRWGDPRSPVRIDDEVYEGEAPPFAGAPAVLERRGCDADPIDPTTDEGRLTLLSYVWPDQERRVQLLRAALDVAARVPLTVESAPAGEWIEHALSGDPEPGVTTVVFHSIFLQYLDDAERHRVRAAIEGAGAAAPVDAPLAWLRMEPEVEMARLDATLFAAGSVRELTLGRAGYHGRPVRWRLR
jgi:hypothetical protein